MIACAAVVSLTALSSSLAPAFTDLEVTYIERNPKYKSYQGRVQYGGKTFTDDYTPYYATYAYGLSGQTPATKRWPDPGETVTFTAHVYNRGDTTVTSFAYEWRLDDAVIGSGTYSTAMAPGDFATLDRTWSWSWGLHRIKFAIVGHEEVQVIVIDDADIRIGTQFPLLFHGYPPSCEGV